MATVLNSKVFAPADRSEAFHAALSDVLMPPTKLLDMVGDAHGALRVWALGAEVALVDFTISTTQPLRMARMPRALLRESNPERISVAINPAGFVLTDHRGVRTTGRKQLRLTELTSDYGIALSGDCRSVACEIDVARLDLPIDAIRAAVSNVSASPLHDLMRRHLLELARSADGLPPSTLAIAGSGTAELARALVHSVSSRDRDRRAALAETMPAQIDDYVRRHLGDPNLTPARIAAAHNISLRYLYVLLSDRAETPAEWIMSRRLAAAKIELEQGSSNVSTTAQRWGFRDHSHFTRRFKAAFGLTPSEFARRTQQTLP